MSYPNIKIKDYFLRSASILSLVSPYILIFNLVFVGFLNYQPMKSIMFFVGLVPVIALSILIQTQINRPAKGASNKMCSIAREPLSIDHWDTLPAFTKLMIGYDNPSMIMILNMFAVAYLLFSMMMHSQYNVAYILFYSIYSIYTLVTLGGIGCFSWMSLIFGSFLGLIFGTLWFFIVHGINKKYTFLSSSSSDNVQCYEPNKRKFKCSVYKNGVIVKNL